MILEQQKQVEILQEGESQESIKMSLDMDSAPMLMQMLSKNIYSDSVSSTIRETVSNALDSKRRAKSDKPVIVRLKVNGSSNYEFTVEDFGAGLDDNDVRDILSKYGKSTKRDSADELGMWGLGFKSPLSYSSSFTFICRKDGMERSYIMYEGEDVNTIDLLYEKPTSEPSGVKVIVPVKYGDRNEFLKKIREQLAYFEDVYFDVAVSGSYYYSDTTIPNDFKIHRDVDFQWSELSDDKNMHICLDNIYYPIDFDKLGIKKIEVPIGLRFGLTDGVFPTINRESIRYTPEVKEIIINKIATVGDYFVNKYNETIAETDDPYVIFDHYRRSSRDVHLQDKVITINTLIVHANVTLKNPTLKGVSLLDLNSLSSDKNVLFKEYHKKYKLHQGRMSAVKENYERQINVLDNENYFIYSNDISNNKKSYLKDIVLHNTRYYLIKKVKSFPLRDPYRGWTSSITDYYTALDLKKHPRGEWRARIKEFQYIQSLLIGKMKNIDDIEIPAEWLEARKKKTVQAIIAGRTVKAEGEVHVKVGRPLEVNLSGQSCKFVPEILKIENFEKTPSLHVYGLHDDKQKLDNIYEISRTDKEKITVLTFSQREINTISKFEIHNLISYDEFMKGENKPFKRLVTAYLIQKLMSKYSKTFERSYALKDISTKLYDKLQALEKYKNEHYSRWCDNSVYSAMLEVANANNAFDTTIYSDYLEVKQILDRLTFIEPMCGVMDRYRNSDSEKFITILCDLFKYHKFRIDYTRYNLVMNDDVTDKELSEDVIEELVNV